MYNVCWQQEDENQKIVIFFKYYLSCDFRLILSSAPSVFDTFLFTPESFDHTIIIHYSMCWQEQLWERWKQCFKVSRLSHMQCRRMMERTCSFSAPSLGSSYYPAAWISKHKDSSFSQWWCSRGIRRYPVSGCTSMCWTWMTTPLFSIRIHFLRHCWKTRGLAHASFP